MLRNVLKAIGWTAGSLAGLVAVLYLVALAINGRDRPPSAAAKQLMQVSRDRPAVADANNAYVYLQHWQLDPDRRFNLSAPVREFLETCAPGRPECAAAFDSSDGLLAEWSAADGELLIHYTDFSARSGWHEGNTFTMESIPGYAGAADGQKMLLLRARELAQQGDAGSVRLLLERDLRFWRTVLQSSDIMVSKMIATGALNRHFEWGSLVLRSLPAAKQAEAIPAGWRSPISDDERSMERCLAGEWLFASAMLKHAPAISFGIPEDQPVARVVARFIAPMYQEQDTINQYAEQYLNVAHAFHVPLDDYPKVAADVRESARQTAADLFPFGPVYNMAGGWTFALSLIGTDLTDYTVRVGDIEGVRRAALTGAVLRARGVAAKDVSAALANAEQRDPYTDQPFRWDQQTSAIVFSGLQRGERREHRIYY